MRVLLFTGKGGVGKTTVAAATAAHVAGRGGKTLVVSTDPAHSLADAFGLRLGPDPAEVDTGLYAMQVHSQRRFEQSWAEVGHYLAGLLAAGGGDLQAEELVVLPGAEEVLALLEVRDQVGCGRWDVVVVDCAATAETLRLLALPDTLAWYVERVLPAHRRMLRTVRPLLGTRAGGAALPPEPVLDAVTRLHAELADVGALLRDPGVSPRLVLTPESVVAAEARRTLTGLALLGFRVDEVVVNRVFPTGGGDAWRVAWVEAQQRVLAEIAASFAGRPLRTLSYRPGEPVGLPALLDAAGELYGQDDPLAVSDAEPPMRVERAGEHYELVLVLPLAERDELALARSGDDLVLTVGGRRRMVALPSVLRRCTVEGAALRSGTLRVRFRPDPAQWPAGLLPAP